MHFRSILAIVSCLLFLLSTIVSAKVSSVPRDGIATMMKYGTNDPAVVKRDRGTWYSGNDLKNAACYGRSGLPRFSAKVNDMIGAMAMRRFEYCYKCMLITNKKNNKRIIVKIVDKCAGCKVGTAIDLTPGAFKKLNNNNVDDGVLDIKWKAIRCPRRGLRFNL
ncbi:unnamed protein product [Cunninghamella blakesleeana]